MTTSIEDNELNAELQELYLADKHWISDLDFLETEIGFLVRLSMTAPVSEVKDELDKRINSLTSTYKDLKTEVLNFLGRLAPVTIAKEKKINISLIEDHSRFKLRLEALLLTFQSEKKAIFELSLHDHSLKQPDCTQG